MFSNSLRAVHGCTAIFSGRKPLKMRAIRKPRFSNGDAEKAMDGFLRRFTSSLLKNPVFLQAACGTWMYRHFQWLQAAENESHSKTTFFEWRR
ncbi:MAG: hypothetical protein DRR11_15945 [Gammaproteobacteria bacterium]|nr:MAG: hypothetical protein DRR11_15945 [Gammaproteobacteria bacterium]